MPTIVNSTIGTGLDFANGALWVAGTAGDLVADDEQHNGLIEETQTARVSITGSTADATRYRNLTFGPILGRYDPITDTGAQLKGADGTRLLSFGESFARATAIGVDNTSTGAGAQAVNLITNGIDNLLEELTIKRTGNDAGQGGHGFELLFNVVSRCIVRNCAFISDGTGSPDAVRLSSTDTVLDNCTAFGWGDEGFKTLGGGPTYVAPFEMINLISMGNGGADITIDGNSLGFMDSCLTEDATASTISNSFDTQVIADTLVDAANDNLKLVLTGNAVLNGADLSAQFTNDIEGSTRTVPFDMGCYLFSVADQAEVVTVGEWDALVTFAEGDCLLIVADGTEGSPDRTLTDPEIRVNINLTPQ